MTHESRLLFETITGWLLWLAYFGGIGGTWVWLVIIVRDSPSQYARRGND